MRTLVVGYGASIESRGSFHAKNAVQTPGYEIVGVCDRNDEARRRGLLEFPQAKSYTDFSRALAELRPELVVVCTPNESHCELTVESVRAGAHVAVEKPMTTTVRDADQMIEESRRAGRILTVLHNRRWDSDFLFIKERIQAGALGKVFAIDSTMDQLIRPSGWRADPARAGGHVYDWGPHLLDQLTDLLGEGPRWVVAYATDLGWDTGVDTWARLQLGYSDNRLVTVQVASNAWVKRPRWHVCGAKGGIIVSGKRFSLTTREERREGEVPWQRPPNVWAHLQRVAARQEALWVKPEQVRIHVQVIEAAMESIRHGNRQVSLDGGRV